MASSRRDTHSVTIGKRRRVLSVGEGVAEALGVPSEALLSGPDSFTKRIHPVDAQILGRILLRPRRSPPGAVELRVRAANGEMRRLRWDHSWQTMPDEPNPVLTLELKADAKKAGIPH